MGKVDIFSVATVFSRKLFSQVLAAPTADSVKLWDHRKGRSWHDLNCMLSATEALRETRNVWACRYKHIGLLTLQTVTAKCQQPLVEDGIERTQFSPARDMQRSSEDKTICSNNASWPTDTDEAGARTPKGFGISWSFRKRRSTMSCEACRTPLRVSCRTFTMAWCSHILAEIGRRV
jgi:hypothetical protein